MIKMQHEEKIIRLKIEPKKTVGSSQPVAFIVSSYTTTIVRELNDDSYSFI
jgi:hypothetical protein